MRGRKAIPDNVRSLHGMAPAQNNRGAAKFSPEPSIPRCPAHLTGAARKEWKRITEVLDRYKMISEADLGALSMLCTAWGRHVAAEAMIAKAAEQAPGTAGLFVKSPNGYPIQSPWLAVSNKAIAQYQSLCAEFGLTPAGRVRITVDEADKTAAGDGEAPDNVSPMRKLLSGSGRPLG